ncbi:MAG: hypothetical protein IPP06_18210 [Saprospiraceae bacterium]|nr:hypothetical protein [Candidatus Vicinibacter affinis]MBP6173449.1 hypothetical protein [Saprospiraceae bacterium]MBK6570937.1 hypothetical protein [Candidatus Vicinibacter affinis]MBK6823726.1 hypothetical protein [Candidatus Vicinibacter affinis]MBK7303316.1 hypothetical protein [Candidatus Vicinibacter affinis]
MNRISSNATLFFVIFLPTFWLVFFGSLGLGLWMSSAEDISFTSASLLKIVYLILFLGFGTIIYFTLLRLKRIEIDSNYLYITNYLKTIKVPFSEVNDLHVKSLFFRSVGRITFNYKTFFGKKIYFLCNSEHYDFLRAQVEKVTQKNNSPE